MRGRRVRIAYLTIAAVAFYLLLVDGNRVPIATSGFIVVAALLGAIRVSRHERQAEREACKPEI